MAEVSVKIHGRNYGVACDDGQEQRVSALAHYVDERLGEIARAGAAASDSHLQVLTALVLADEIFDLKEHMENLVQTVQQAPAQTSGRVSEEEEELIVRAIDSLAQRIEIIAGRIETP
jgi:cell division protein ZapA